MTSGDGLTSIDTGRDKASSTKSIKGLNSDERVVGIDYRPASDKLYGLVVKRSGKVRVVKISPATGNTYASRNLTTVDGMLKFGAGDKNAGKSARVPSIAYTNSVKGAAQTTLYDIEAGTNGLLQQAPPNDGTLKGSANTALISNTSKGQTKIYRISLANGDVAATSSIKGKSIIAIAAPTGR